MGSLEIQGFEKELFVVEDLMRQAGKIILDNYDDPKGVERKPDGSWITGVDKRVSELITSRLQEEFPDYGILDEERKQDETRFTRARCWHSDPLDGTRGYIYKTGDFGVIIGLTEYFQPIFGATYKPQKDELVVAAKGQGTYIIVGNGEPEKLKVKNTDEVHVLVSNYRGSDELDDMLKKLKPDSVGYMGGSLKTIEVARGNATLFLCPITSTMSLWDLCAPSVVLEEAGGRITNRYGNPFNYASRDTTNHNGVVATNGVIHERVLYLIDE